MRKSDTALLERWVVARDPEAFSAIVERHAGMVLATCRRVLGNGADAEETTQDCFLKLSQADSAGVASLGGWLHRMATNRALDRLRSDTRRAAREQEFAAGLATIEAPGWDDIQAHVDEIIAQLPEELQTPLVLHFFEGQTHKAVAKGLGVSRSTVTGRIQKAIGEIRTQLDARKITLGLGTLVALFEAYEVQAAPPALLASLNKMGLAAGKPVAAMGIVAGGKLIVAALAAIVAATALWALGLPDDPAPQAPAPVTAATPPVEARVETPPQPAVELVLAQATPEALPAATEEDLLRLRCIDAAGEPVAGAEVYYVQMARSIPPMTHDNRPDDTTMTPFGPVLSDSEGCVAVPNVSDANKFGQSYAAYARVADKLVGAWNYFPGRNRGENWNSIVLVESTRIGGTVNVPKGLDPTRVTVNVLTLRIRVADLGIGGSFPASSKYRPPVWPELFSTSPGADGSFSLGDLPAGQACYLEFTAPGLGEAQYYTFAADAAEPIAVAMMPEAVIAGTVRQTSGAPAVDVPVFATPYGGSNSGLGVTTSFQGRTDSLGRYRIVGLPKDVYSVKVQHYGEPTSEISSVVPMLEVQSGLKLEGVDFEVERGAVQEGILLDEESGTPIPDAWLVAMNPGDVENQSLAQSIGVSNTDGDGKFAFRLPTGVSFLYFFSVPENYVPPKESGTTFVRVEPGQSTLPPLSLSLSKKSEAEMAPIQMTTIEGRVVDPNGNPLAGVPIAIGRKYMYGDDERQQQTPSQPTKDDGRFSIKVQATGEYQLVIGGKQFSRDISDWFAVKADEKSTFPDIAVERYEQVIVVKVSNFNDSAQVSLPDVVVSLRETGEYLNDDILDRQGHIEFYVPNAPLKIGVGQEGYKYVEADIDPGMEIEITLEPDH